MPPVLCGSLALSRVQRTKLAATYAKTRQGDKALFGVKRDLGPFLLFRTFGLHRTSPGSPT